jgi:NAD(P) transhydrogenase subunit alpha
MRIAVPRESAPHETRVALVPETVAKLTKTGLIVAVERGAGERAGFTDDAYREAGAAMVADAREACESADVVLRFQAPAPHPQLGIHEVDLIREGAALIGFLGRDRDGELAARLRARRVTAFSMELVPRISRAQKMDAMSSLSTIAGYKAVLIAAASLPRVMPLLMTAAGTLAPARAFVIGAGVAGLQAIATARRLGAVVEAFDVRPAVREEVQSLGATFVGLDLIAEQAVDKGGYAKELSADHQARERALIEERLKASDLVITTAMIPGRPAPILVTEAMVKQMKPGSVIVDMAAETGGNCALTRARETVVAYGVTIIGAVNLASTVPYHGSQMYSRNVSALLTHLIRDGALHLDFADEITRESCLVGAPAAAGATAAPAPVAATRGAAS